MACVPKTSPWAAQALGMTIALRQVGETVTFEAAMEVDLGGQCDVATSEKGSPCRQQHACPPPFLRSQLHHHLQLQRSGRGLWAMSFFYFT